MVLDLEPRSVQFQLCRNFDGFVHVHAAEAILIYNQCELYVCKNASDLF